jgi:hypothetical protein
LRRCIWHCARLKSVFERIPLLKPIRGPSSTFAKKSPKRAFTSDLPCLWWSPCHPTLMLGVHFASVPLRSVERRERTLPCGPCRHCDPDRDRWAPFTTPAKARKKAAVAACRRKLLYLDGMGVSLRLGRNDHRDGIRVRSALFSGKARSRK